MADRQNLYARGFPGVFHRARKTKKSKWILSDGHRAAAHVGHQDEADEEREVGDSVRPERGVGAKITCSIMEGGESNGIPSGKERQTARHRYQNVT